MQADLMRLVWHGNEQIDLFQIQSQPRLSMHG